MTDLTLDEIEALLCIAEKGAHFDESDVIPLARQLLAAQDRSKALAKERDGFQQDLDVVLGALLPFWDQCQRGETENPERWQETYLALDDVLRRLL